MKNKEIERKFIIDPTKIPYNLKKMDYKDIIQGYVTSIDRDLTFRLRHVLYRSQEGDLLGEEFFQTIKGKGTKIRDEFEIKLWKNQFSQMWVLCKNRSLHKFRYELPSENYKYELDQYKNNLSPLWTIEVEFDTLEECDSFIPPKWFGEEITEDNSWSNLSLALNDKVEKKK